MTSRSRTNRLLCGLALLAAASPAPARPSAEPAALGIFARDHLVAWCIVPFDAKKRGPAQHDEMRK